MLYSIRFCFSTTFKIKSPSQNTHKQAKRISPLNPPHPQSLNYIRHIFYHKPILHVRYFRCPSLSPSLFAFFHTYFGPRTRFLTITAHTAPTAPWFEYIHNHSVCTCHTSSNIERRYSPFFHQINFQKLYFQS